jgi:hypothetical protein
MRKTGLTVCLQILTVFFSLSVSSSAQEVNTLSKTPEETFKSIMSNPNFKTSPGGESFCWHASAEMGRFVANYKLSKNTEWLDEGVKYYDWLISKMITDPDGYRGWIGQYDYDHKYWTDALVGDALLLSGILEFSAQVMADNGLKAKYLEKAKSYVKIAEKDFFEKWDHKGCWYDDYPFGSYIFPVKYLKPDNLKEWQNVPKISNAGKSLPFNMQAHAAELLLWMYKTSGDKKYRDRAESIYFTAKNHFQYFNGHYCWNYWEPLAPGDINLEKNTPYGWVGVHQWRSHYQAGEAVDIVYAYHRGIVFDKTDIQRILNTNLKVMWNGDKVKPKFINSNGLGADGDTVGLAAFKKTWGESNAVKNGGELWTALLDFDQTVRDIYELRFKANKNSDDYLRYKNTVLVNPPGFERKYVETQGRASVKVPVVNFTECKDLNCATVLPHNITDKQKSIIICKSWIAGDLKIGLYTTKNKLVTNLYDGKIKDGFFMITWDGKDPAKKAIYKGDYKIRWTINGGYREFPVIIH